jgi:hypothetical protein
MLEAVRDDSERRVREERRRSRDPLVFYAARAHRSRTSLNMFVSVNLCVRVLGRRAIPLAAQVGGFSRPDAQPARRSAGQATSSSNPQPDTRLSLVLCQVPSHTLPVVGKVEVALSRGPGGFSSAQHSAGSRPHPRCYRFEGGHAAAQLPRRHRLRARPGNPVALISQIRDAIAATMYPRLADRAHSYTHLSPRPGRGTAM